MKHSVHDMVSNQFARSLKALRVVLKKGQAHAHARKFDENLLLKLRISPDMFPLDRQVGISTDIAKGAVARLTGKTAPTFADGETTVQR